MFKLIVDHNYCANKKGVVIVIMTIVIIIIIEKATTLAVQTSSRVLKSFQTLKFPGSLQAAENTST